jgi:type IV pilus assembly protein PilM
MARRLIGLDVGTNAVTIAEVAPGSPPRLDMFAQVALARSAMREGEVADDSAVTDAVSRLRGEVGLKKTPVRVGIASPRVVVRQVEMPVMTRDELASALQFQAGELIPIPIEDAVLDFAILGSGTTGEGGEPTMQVLLAAAYEATVMRLVSAVESGGFPVAAVDLIPLALIRALAHPVPAMVPASAGGGTVDDGVGAEGIVSIGGGATSIAVHEGGVPQFVRVISTGGRELTDAIASDLQIPSETAETLKRQIGSATNDEMVARARAALDRPLSVLLDEVRSSIDYYRNQPGAARLLRVVATGGTAQLPGLPERLAALVGVPVEHASMHDLLRVGNIGFSPDELPRLEPYLPAAVGLALGGAGVGTVVDLLPKARRNRGVAGVGKARPQIDKRLVAGVAVGVALLGGLTYMANQSASSAKSKEAAAEAQATKLQTQITQAQQALSGGGGGSLQLQAAAILGTDVEWPRVVSDIGRALPAGVKLTAFQGQRELPLPTAAGGASTTATPTASSSGSSASPGGAASYAGAIATARSGAAAESSHENALAARAGSENPTGTGSTPNQHPGPVISAACVPLSGNITMSGTAPNLPALAQFLNTLLAQDGDLASVWMSSAQAQAASTTGPPSLTFTVNATLAEGAHSNRIGQFLKGEACR